MRYDLWARIDGVWQKVYATNYYEFAMERARWRWQRYKTAMWDNEKQTLTMLK